MIAESRNAQDRSAFLLTHNPRKFDFDPEILADWIDATAHGRRVEDNWSTGGTTRKIQPGDRAYLMRLGVQNRGIFASGWFTSDVYQDEHWDGSGGSANYADIRWDVVIDPEAALPIERLQAEIPQVHWTPQSSGMTIPPGDADSLDALWKAHVEPYRVTGYTPGADSTASRGQGLRIDVALRKQIEDLAQDRLMDHFSALGWAVEDMRVGNSFDARATKGDEVLYLEAKGTVTAGEKVIVTRGEVEFARDHPRRCVIGIVSGIELLDGQAVDPSSGTLDLFKWNPADDDLVPRQFDFYPPEKDQLSI
ncbi:DUF3883 domain-containing protein [Nocardia zapadnayensis]|nr:DUF3883 domain-containing protein [Nocardia zapadnayensis]MCX0278255.1 DUF3883 domain-containing protein [Nocardia zapadnayensis]